MQLPSKETQFFVLGRIMLIAASVYVGVVVTKWAPAVDNQIPTLFFSNFILEGKYSQGWFS